MGRSGPSPLSIQPYTVQAIRPDDPEAAWEKARKGHDLLFRNNSFASVGTRMLPHWMTRHADSDSAGDHSTSSCYFCSGFLKKHSSACGA